MNSPFELIMLICFGLSWPFAAYKSYRSRSTRGKSLVFLCAIWLGYISGILHKAFYSPDWIVSVYLFNFCIVSLDLFFYARNRRLENEQGSLADDFENTV